MSTPIIAGLAALLLATAAPVSATPEAPGDLFLAGGSLGTCSELAPRACTSPMPARDGARQAPVLLFDPDGIARALEFRPWDRPDGVPVAAMEAVLRHVAARSGGRPVSGRDAADRLAAVCVNDGGRTRAVRCPAGDARAPWQRLTADERSALLSAFELPQLHDGARAVERADPGRSRSAGGTAVLEAFVDAARVASGRERPRIAFVTASAWDVFEPVDFYQSTFDALGAQAHWWPVDAALNAAVHGGGCDALEDLRRSLLGLPGRGRLWPDLVAAQRQACDHGEHLALLPFAVDGVFFAGGDQWRLRQAFVDAGDAPNAWLQALREAHARGLVVGGTSAGAAVQSGAAMLSNGSTAMALAQPPLMVPPPPPGCARAGRCPDGVDEDALTAWPAGGTGLAGEAIVDTHFSERGRELRLVALMAHAGAPMGYGADEASALRLVGGAHGPRIQAVGEAGGWVFADARLRDGGHVATAWYLGDGSALGRDGQGLALAGTVQACADAPDAGDVPGDALDPGALRAAARALAACGAEGLTLRAGPGTATLARTADTAVVRHGEHLGIGPLILTWTPDRP
ncbi:MAG: hypothetical protein ACXIUZ_08600 [Lysobacteraceae bacterium]